MRKAEFQQPAWLRIQDEYRYINNSELHSRQDTRAKSTQNSEINYMNLVVFPLAYVANVVALSSEDTKFIIRVSNFELVELICSRYLSVTDGQSQTDGRTDGRLLIAIPRFALRASRSNE